MTADKSKKACGLVLMVRVLCRASGQSGSGPSLCAEALESAGVPGYRVDVGPGLLSLRFCR